MGRHRGRSKDMSSTSLRSSHDLRFVAPRFGHARKTVEGGEKTDTVGAMRTTRWLVWLACGSLSGCVLVKPTERQHLALPEMEPATDELEETWQFHVEAAREGGFGGHGAAGGGCGCG